MKKHSILFFFLFLALRIPAQSIVDSLYKALPAMRDDTHKVLTYRHLYRALYREDKTTDMLEVAEKGLTLSRALSYRKGTDLFLFYKAGALDMLGRGIESIPLYEEGLHLAEQKGDQSLVADYHVNIGSAYYGLGKLDLALPAYLKAHDMYQKLEDKENLSKVLNNIGIIYRKKKKYDRAEEIYRQSLDIKETLKDTLGIAATLQNISGVFSMQDRPEEAIEAQKKALAIYQKYKKKDDIIGSHNLLANIYYNVGRLAESKAELHQALRLLQDLPSVTHGPSTYQLLGNIANDEKDFNLALKYLHNGLALAEKYGQNENRYSILLQLHQAESRTGDFESAYRHLQEASMIRDTLANQSRLSLIEEMQTKFDVTQKDSELKINRLELNERTRQRNGLLLAVASVLILALSIFFGLRSRIRANKRLAEQTLILQKQQMLQREQQHQLDALQAMLQGQEQERSRIASDLHDGLGGLLTSAKSHVNSLKNPASNPGVFEKTNQLMDEACSEVRRIAYNMMPRALALSGLQGALEDLAQDLRSQGIQCELEMIGVDPSIPPDKTLMIFRIIQELANNVAKHANATHLLLQLIQKENVLTIIAEDDGHGFDVSKAMQQKGLGLSNIQSRVKYLQGEMNWDSRVGEGTSVSVQCRF